MGPKKKNNKLSNAEKQRLYRERRKINPQKDKETKRKDCERYHLEKKLVHQLSQRDLRERRKKVKERVQRYRKNKKEQTNSALSDVQEQAECILPDLPIVPNLDVVKKEPVNYTEKVIPSTIQNILLESSSGLSLSVKLEPTDDYVNDMTVHVSRDDVDPLAASTIEENSSTSMSYKCVDNIRPPPKRPNLSLSPSKSNTEIKDEFYNFGDFVASKIRSFTDRHLQVEAQHRITNMLFEMELKHLNKDSLPVISKISSLEKSLPVTVIIPSSSNSNFQPEMPGTMILLPSSTLNQISSLQTQIPVTTTLPSSSAIKVVKLAGTIA